MPETPEDSNAMSSARSRAPHRARLWMDIMVGLTAFLWLAVFVAVPLSPRHVSVAPAICLTVAAAMMSIICAVVFTAVSNGQAVDRLVRGFQEQSGGRYDDLQRQISDQSILLSRLSFRVDEAIRQSKWQGYSDATEDLSPHVVAFRRSNTGDLTSHLNNRGN